LFGLQQLGDTWKDGASEPIKPIWGVGFDTSLSRTSSLGVRLVHSSLAARVSIDSHTSAIVGTSEVMLVPRLTLLSGSDRFSWVIAPKIGLGIVSLGFSIPGFSLYDQHVTLASGTSIGANFKLSRLFSLEPLLDYSFFFPKQATNPGIELEKMHVFRLLLNLAFSF